MRGNDAKKVTKTKRGGMTAARNHLIHFRQVCVSIQWLCAGVSCQTSLSATFLDLISVSVRLYSGTLILCYIMTRGL